MDSYQSIKGEQRFNLEIKRSQFITTFAFVQNETSAKAFVSRIKDEFPDANHNCWAYIAGKPNDHRGVNQSDDGEPKGTAGKPMLNVLQHSGLGNIACVVTRYFGGIKLGAGGLVRAYSQSVSEFLPELERQTCYEHIALEFSVSYPMVGNVEYWLKTEALTIEDQQYGDRVTFKIALPEPKLASTQQSLNELCSGNILFSPR